MAGTGFDLALSIGITNAARQRDGAVVRQHIAVERIQRRIVDVRLEHAFAQVVEDDHRRFLGLQPNEASTVPHR